MQSPDPIDQVHLLIQTHMRALGEGDLEALIATMTDDIECDLVGGSPNRVRGKDAVRAHFMGEFANTMGERVIPLRRLYGAGFVVDEAIWEGRVTGRVGPLVGNGRRVTQRVLRIFETRDCRIARQTVYADFAALALQLPSIAPEVKR
jgi:ketosteroid isomerase-like protein